MIKTELKIGEIAPNFILPDQKNEIHSLAENRGKWVLVYFYPKDDTPGCVKEACAIRDAFPDFKKLGIKVFGISIDSVSSHQKFAAKYDLPFIILSDSEKKTVSDYGVFGKKKFIGKEYEGTFRSSFLIDPQGRIAKIYNNVKPEIHAEEVLNDLALIKI